MRGLRGALRRARGDVAGARLDHARAVELARVDGGSSHRDRRRWPRRLPCMPTQGELDGGAGPRRGGSPDHRGRPAAPEHCSSWSAFAELLGVRDSLLEAVRASPSRRADFWRDAAVVALERDLIAAADFVSQTGAVAIESTAALPRRSAAHRRGTACRGQARARARARVLPRGRRVGLCRGRSRARSPALRASRRS